MNINQELKKNQLFLKKSLNEEVEVVEDSHVNFDLDVDEPLRVVDSKMDQKRKVLCLVEWKVRSDGMKPDISYINTEILKEKFPKFLIDYYESRIKFVK